MNEPDLLYAWIGEDELGSGQVGIKQALCPAGCIPLVAVNASKLSQPAIMEQLQAQASKYGKTIRLCRFVYDGDVRTLDP